MKVAVIGTGYVGLVSGVCFSEFGYDVTCVDQDPLKIASLQRGQVPIYEPGLEALMSRNSDRLTFTTELAPAVSNAEIVFLAVGTPSRRGDGEADLSYVFAAAEQIAALISPGTIIVIKSTVVVGTAKKVQEIIQRVNPASDFSIASNPEFLREGSAIDDFLRPDRVVIGVEDERAREALARLYRPLNLRDTPIIFTTLTDAEITKYAANAFLAMKITFINEIADLCEKVAGDVQSVARAIGLDKRIGSKFLHPGPGYGGSCFPKDTSAMAAIGRRYGSPLRLIETTVQVNNDRIASLSKRVKAASGGSVSKQIIGVLGIAFKPNTDDCRESASLSLIADLQGEGATIRAHDPQAVGAAREILSDVIWCDTPYEVAANADILVILTEWNEYRALDLDALSDAMRCPIIFDMRNIYKPDEMAARGIQYHSMGRSPVGKDTTKARR